MPAPGQRPVLGSDAPGQHGAVENGEDKSDLPGAEGQRQGRDLGNHDRVVGMAQEAVSAAPHQRRDGQLNCS